MILENDIIMPHLQDPESSHLTILSTLQLFHTLYQMNIAFSK